MRQRPKHIQFDPNQSLTLRLCVTVTLHTRPSTKTFFHYICAFDILLVFNKTLTPWPMQVLHRCLSDQMILSHCWWSCALLHPKGPNRRVIVQVLTALCWYACSGWYQLWLRWTSFWIIFLLPLLSLALIYDVRDPWPCRKGSHPAACLLSKGGVVMAQG